MNGRLFDPYTGRFLSADSHIQDPTELQSYNRYSYCWNSPMGCTDPTGYFSWKKALTGGLIAGDPMGAASVGLSIVINNYQQRIVWDLQRQLPGQRAIDNYIMSNQWAYMAGQMVATYYGGTYGAMAWSSYYSYVGSGSMTQAMRTAATTYVVATAFNVAGDVGEIYGLNSWQAYAAQAGAGCVSGQLQGGGCGRGAVSAMVSHGISEFATTQGIEQNSITGFAVTVVSGGTASVLTGGKFANGAQTAAFQYMFNCLAHQCLQQNWDNSADGYHSYELTSPTLCNVGESGCMAAASHELLCSSAPGQSKCAIVGIERQQKLTAGNDITQYAISDRAVINGTDPSHMLHDGYVIRNIEVDSSGNVRIRTFGEGVNIPKYGLSASQMSNINTTGGKALFQKIGVQNQINVRNALSITGN